MRVRTRRLSTSFKTLAGARSQAIESRPSPWMVDHHTVARPLAGTASRDARDTYLLVSLSALSVSIGLGGSVLRPLLTSVRAVQGYPRPPRPFGQALLTHYASQISPNKDVNFRCTSSPSTLESVGNGFAVHGQLTSGSLWASYGVSVRSLAALAWMWRPGLIGRLTSTSAGFLSTVRCFPRSCLRLVL